MHRPLTVRFWGVRGTFPTPGSSTVRYGGNTACVSVHLGNEITLVLDAGTGIRNLGKTLASTPSEIYVVVTHNHWDHIQGFPAFQPLYQRRRVHCLLPTLGETITRALIEQMDGTRFPVEFDTLLSDRRVIFDDPRPVLTGLGLHTDLIPLNHPGGGFGYRVANDGRTIVYLTDNELAPPADAEITPFSSYVEFCRGADVLIHDAQYLPADMPAKHGWGHSVLYQTLQLAVAAGVKHLVLFHHDPDRSDDDLDAMQAEARSWLQAQAPAIRCTVAFEGLTLHL